MSQYTAWRVYGRFASGKHTDEFPVWKSCGDQLALFTTKKAAKEHMRSSGALMRGGFIRYRAKKVEVHIVEVEARR